MFKELLVHVKSHESWSAHIDLAFALAARFKAHLTGVVPHESLAIAKLLAEGPGGGGQWIADLQTAADAQTAILRAAFEQRLRERGISGELQVAEGRAHEVLALAGRFQDLIIVEQTNLAEDDINWSTAEEAAVQSGRPTLIAPRDVASDGAFKRILLAWNGGREATRALHAALPFLTEADEVLVLQGRPREIAASVTKPPPGDIESYLKRRTRSVKVLDNALGDADAAVRILDVVKAQTSDLIVMGAYGRRGLSRLILGGATSRVFREARIPILAAH